MARQINLQVNGNPIALDHFVQSFIEHTTAGMVEALEATAPAKTINLSIEGDRVILTVNDRPVTINAFVTRIVKSTALGMIAPLKGVSQPNTVHVSIVR